MHQSPHAFIQPAVQQSALITIFISLRPTTSSSLPLASSNPPIQLLIQPFTHPSIRPSLRPSVCSRPSMFPSSLAPSSIHQFIHPLTHIITQPAALVMIRPTPVQAPRSGNSSLLPHCINPPIYSPPSRKAHSFVHHSPHPPIHPSPIAPLFRSSSRTAD
jgi:hypothetical protein